MKCADIMTFNPKCHDYIASVELIAKTMKEDNIGPVPIVDNRESMRLVGIITDRDVAVKVVAENRDATTTKARDVMTINPVSCYPHDDVKKALAKMEQCQIRRMPIVDLNNRLIGIIAQADIATKLDGYKTAELLREVSQDEPKVSHH